MSKKKETAVKDKNPATVTIKGREYKIAYNIDVLLYCERITGKPYDFESKFLLDKLIFYYCVILANNADDPDVLTFDEFKEEVNTTMFSDPIIRKIDRIVASQMSLASMLSINNEKKSQEK